MILSAHNSKKTGFTLIELLVVISIIGLLSSIVLSSLNSARQKAQGAAIAQNLYQLRMAMELYLASNATVPEENSNMEGIEGIGYWSENYDNGFAGTGNFNLTLAPLVSSKSISALPKSPGYPTNPKITFGYISYPAELSVNNMGYYYTCGDTKFGRYTFYVYYCGTESIYPQCQVKGSSPYDKKIVEYANLPQVHYHEEDSDIPFTGAYCITSS